MIISHLREKLWTRAEKDKTTLCLRCIKVVRAIFGVRKKRHSSFRNMSNLFQSFTGRSSPESQIQSWFNEKSDYNYNTNGCTLNEMCGHYTQVRFLF